MLRSAGFVDIDEMDVTAAFLRTARGWVEARERHGPQVRKALGEADFEQKQAESRAQVQAIEAGLLQRSLFLAKRSR